MVAAPRLVRRHAVTLVAMFMSASVWAQSPTRPNILFILADDLGFGDLGVTGQNARAAQGLPSIATPNIDALAQAGVRFNNMYAGGTVCTPSRAVLMTGFHSGHTIVDRGLTNALRAGDADRTWGQVLQDAGYNTGMFGKWHLGGVPLPGHFHALPPQKGFETAYGSLLGTYRSAVHFETNGLGGMRAVLVPLDPSWTGPEGPYAYGDDLVANRAEQFIRDMSAAAEPFAAYVAFLEPHTVHEMVPQDHPYVNMPWAKGLRDYAGLVHRLDQHVGQLVSAIEDPNGDGDKSDSIASNTMIIFTSDNGVVWDGASEGFQYEFFNSNGPYAFHKWTTGDGATRTPFFIRWDGKIGPGTVNDSYVGSFADIMPTFAELSGHDAPLGVDGRSMLSDILGGPPSDKRDVLMWFTERGAFANQPLNYAVRVGDWKLYVQSPVTDGNGAITIPATPLKLFNLADDPGEAINLRSSRPDIVAALQAIIVAEGGLREPTLPWFTDKPPGNPSTQPESVNTYFTQYKTWSPQAGSTNFFAAGNWSGGTQYWLPGLPEAQNWNTGPADNWLATMENLDGAPQQVSVDADAAVLALELRGASTMTLHVNQGVTFTARNGVRISGGGVLHVHNGEINTIRDLEIRPGGRLEGEGLVNGQQSVVANIPEFANLGLFEPRVVNRGVVAVASDTDSSLDAGRLLVQGDYLQEATGSLRLDILSIGTVGGLDFDQLVVTGDVTLDGSLQISAPNPLQFVAGQEFEIITVSGARHGVFSSLSAPALPGNLTWALQYMSSSVRLGVVDWSIGGGPFDYVAQFRQSLGVNSAADLDGDGDTDGFDFLIWQRGAFMIRPSAAGAHVPEPAGLALAGLFVLAVLGPMRARRRRRSTTAC